MNQPDFRTPWLNGDGTLALAWQIFLQLLTANVVKPHTVPLAKLTTLGANGSITFDQHGRVTGYQDPT